MRGEESTEAFEAPFYSDAIVTGHMPAKRPCPYSFLNAGPYQRDGRIEHAVTLRVQYHLTHESMRSTEATDTSRYHGGTLVDEIASLAALTMGCRIRSGGITRMFWPEDPLGRPQADSDIPSLPPRRRRAALLRRARGEHNLNGSLLPLLDSYPRIAPVQATSLVRAARLYSDALWIVESDPQLAWLFLVSALEAVATPIHVQTANAKDVFCATYSDLAKTLDTSGGDSLVETVATRLLPLMKSTARFINFVLAHLPEPLEPRPHPNMQLDWSASSMKKHLSKIYELRSRALHDGTPFPEPMCDAQPLPSEVPVGYGMGTKGGYWLREDTPMLLDTFEHITRGALLRWWSSIAEAAGPPD